MTRRSLRLACLALALSLIYAQARASTIDFESLSELEAVTIQFPGLVFSSATVLTAGSSLNEFEFPPRSGVQVIFDDGGPMRIDFLVPVATFSGYFTYAMPLTLSAFDATGALLGSVHSLFSSSLGLSGDPGSSPNEFLQIAFSGMAYVTVAADLAGASFTADDLTVTSPVPEPGTLGLVLLGAGAALARHRRRSVDNRSRRA